MSATWKPCDRLVPEDFKSNAAWTFDPARVEKDDTSDDTYVRPVKPRADVLDDEVFVRATLTDHDDKPVPNVILRVQKPARSGSAWKPVALVVLKPFFAESEITDNHVPITLSPALQSRLPIRYEIDEKTAGVRIHARGKLTLWAPEKPAAPPAPPVVDKVAEYLENKANQAAAPKPDKPAKASKTTDAAPAKKTKAPSKKKR